MIAYLKTVLRILAQCEPIHRFIDYLYYESHRAVKQRAILRFKRVVAPSGRAQVLRGPFRGMVYPQMIGSGSELGPKIIGSYESELHDTVEKVCRKNYGQIIDIGSGEGYYAVGFAIRCPNVEVFAFDVDREAIELCKAMAIANEVDDRIVLKSTCTIEDLGQFKFNEGKRGFILCDCEGCELAILDPRVVPGLRYCDLLVEVHDFLPSGLSSYEVLRSKFACTHRICPINIKKRDDELYSELASFTKSERKSIIAEHREFSVGWLFMESLAQSTIPGGDVAQDSG